MRAPEGEARMCPTRGDERVSTIYGGSQASEPLIPSRRRRGCVHARATSHHIRQRRERAGLLTGMQVFYTDNIRIISNDMIVR